jgi:hypothetical protein
MADQALPATKAELIDLIDASWTRLKGLVDSIPDEQLNVPGSEGWAVKDHLLHLAGWERMTVAAIKGESEEAAVGLEPWVGEWDEERFNDLLYQKGRDKEATAARRDFEESHRQVMELIAKLDDTTLHADMPNEPGRPNVDKIVGNTYAHFDEHREWIQQLLAAR